jgi:hypothetical protein
MTMYEVWYTEESIPQVVLRDTLDAALQQSIKLFLDEDKVFEYLIGPNGEILNNFVQARLAAERGKRKNKKDRQSGKNFVVEIRAIHRDDFWAVLGYVPNEDAARTRIDQMVMSGVPLDRLRFSELPPEE